MSMHFPKRLTDEEFKLRSKEWMLAGVRVYDRGLDTVVGKVLSEYKKGISFGGWEWYYRYEQQESGDWKCVEKGIGSV